MSAGTEQRKLAAIMFTDMVGYSALAQSNEALALELLEEHRSVLRALFPKHQGTEIKTTGDGFLVEFASALAAVRCAIEIQRSLATRNVASAADRQLQVRIGIHVGDVVHHEGDVLGDGVNIASRIEPLAGPGGICISVDVERQIRNAIETSLVKLGPTELKNIQLPMELFRIVLPWESGPAARAVPTPTARRTHRTLVQIGLMALGVALVLGSVFWLLRSKPAVPLVGGTNAPAGKAPVSPSRIEWLVVLPLRNYSGDTNQDYFVDGMTDILSGELAQIGGLQVKSHTTAMRYKGATKSMPEIGRELHVDAVVEGSVQRTGNQVLISIQLIEAATDRHLWAKKFRRDVTDALQMQSEVAEAIAREIRGHLTPQDEARLARSRPVDPQALEAYLKGRFFWNKRTPAALRTAIEHFQEAIRIDSRFASAYAAMGDCYAILPLYSAAPAKESATAAKLALTTALELDATLGEAHASLGFVKVQFDWDWTGADNEFRQAIALSPNSAVAHQRFGLYFVIQGRFGEALAERKRAEELDPLSLIIKTEVGDIFHFMGQEDQAIDQFRQTLALDPNFARAHWMLGRALIGQGKYAEAIQAASRAAELSPDSPYILASLGRAYALGGKREEAERILRELKDRTKHPYVRSYDLAVICAALDDKDQAFRWLDKAYEDHFGLAALKFSTEVASLRTDPRFQELLRKVGLDK